MAKQTHLFDITRADSNLRSLGRALEAQQAAIGAICELSVSGEAEADADAIEVRTDMELNVHRLRGLIRVETARRDAAELAQRAAKE